MDEGRGRVNEGADGTHTTALSLCLIYMYTQRRVVEEKDILSCLL